MTSPSFPRVPSGYPFPELEGKVLDFWRRERIFARSVERNVGEKEFVFFEGPPTANNTPHVGHVLTRVVKDLFPRFQTMRGRHVARKAGWDTHGLAVEIEVEKRLGLAGKKDIEQLVPGDARASIETFNRACFDSVMTYESQWRAMTERVGYWVDLDDAYFTYSNTYIESVWWSLATLHDKGLLFEGHKSQPYCARCGTTLSSHEVAQNYKEVEDPSIWVLFPARPGRRLKTIDGGEYLVPTDFYLVAWTTTPWTMPGHSGIAVHPDLVYRVVEHPTRPGARVLFADAIAAPVPYEIDIDGKRQKRDLRDMPALARIAGAALHGLRYDRPYRTTPADAQPPSEAFAEPPSDISGWLVVAADYVTATDGTGLVHTAPAFGADDYATGLKYGLPLFQTIEPSGKVAERAGIEKFAGMWFKDADKEVVRDLRDRGLLLHHERFKHSYPFCWRCDTPLLQYATKSWFVKTTAIRDRLVEKNATIDWHPEAIGKGRFGNWLEGVVDWALSRSRYWGTPLPVWKCDGCPAEPVVVGSFDDLFEQAGIPRSERPADVYDRTQFDPHRPYIDDITWPCYACNGGTFRRIPDVIDAWFDSGAMPFAQHHYPFENGSLVAPGGKFRAADFISEAIDQTRGWFYTLHVLASALFDSVAFEHCIVMGHVTDENGRKMSKRLGNVVEPMAVIAETGADAMRWYFYVNDPEQSSRFSAKLVREAAQGLQLPIWNALSFFTIYANLDGWVPGAEHAIPVQDRSDLDRWILGRLDSEIEQITLLLEGYRIAESARRLEGFVDDLTNWYIRRSRDRFWSPDALATSDSKSADKEGAYQTLYTILTTLARIIAPFTPFFAEILHEHLSRSVAADAAPSVHLESWPSSSGILQSDPALLGLVSAMGLAKRIVNLGRVARASHDLKNRQPLASATLVLAPEIFGVDVRPHLERVRAIVLDELNVKDIRFAERRGDFVTHEVRPNFRVLGKKVGGRMKAIQSALLAADGDALAEKLSADGKLSLEVEGATFDLLPEDLEVRLVEKEGMATANDGELLIALDPHLSPELVAEGRAREVVNRLQTARKDAGLDYADRIRVRFVAAPELAAAIIAHGKWIAGETLAVELTPISSTTVPAADLKSAAVDELPFAFVIERAG
ncbi:MAG: isoleucine--tRNA ligase [Thermoanaerobaculia bacterium]